MRRILTIILVGAAAGPLVAKGPPPAPTPIAPSGKWSIEYGKDMCVLSRTFGSGKDQLMFALKPAPNSDQMRLLLLHKTGLETPHAGNAWVRLSDGSSPKYAQARSQWAKGLSLTAIDLPRSSLDPLVAGGTITIAFGPKINYTIAPTAMAAAVKALGACERDLLKNWGMDEAAQDALARPPAGGAAGLFKSDDYPDKLVEQGVQGSVGALLTVDAAGTVSDCRAIEPSGTPELDTVTCTIFKTRAKYRPAVDRSGKAVPALTYYRVNWVIADDWGFNVSPTNAVPPATMMNPVH
jgi:hypothetical protein